MSLFAKEHNAICAALKEREHIEDPEVLYATARLVNTALMTRIHLLDWTAAVLGHKTTRLGTELEWWGLLGKRSFEKRGKRRWRSELLCGIPGSPTKDSGVPFSLTEEFVAVYRMHNMLPDRFEQRDADGTALGQHDELRDLLGPKAIPVLKRDPAALLQTFGHATAGVVSLRNFPLALRAMNLHNDDGGRRDLDLAAVDILRCRELGVPRYNDLRRGLHMAPKRSIEDLTSDAELRTAIHDLYEDIDEVDLLVGLYAEDRPTNCVFSDTAFRIFLLMAPRRMLSDRFFTDDYDVEHYTATGIDWVENNHGGELLPLPRLLAPQIVERVPWPFRLIEGDAHLEGQFNSGWKQLLDPQLEHFFGHSQAVGTVSDCKYMRLCSRRLGNTLTACCRLKRGCLKRQPLFL